MNNLEPILKEIEEGKGLGSINKYNDYLCNGFHFLVLEVIYNEWVQPAFLNDFIKSFKSVPIEKQNKYLLDTLNAIVKKIYEVDFSYRSYLNEYYNDPRWNCSNNLLSYCVKVIVPVFLKAKGVFEIWCAITSYKERGAILSLPLVTEVGALLLYCDWHVNLSQLTIPENTHVNFIDSKGLRAMNLETPNEIAIDRDLRNEIEMYFKEAKKGPIMFANPKHKEIFIQLLIDHYNGAPLTFPKEQMVLMTGCKNHLGKVIGKFWKQYGNKINLQMGRHGSTGVHLNDELMKIMRTIDDFNNENKYSNIALVKFFSRGD